MAADYHKYVFDVENRRFIGDFEAMYKAERLRGFDSWLERDLRPLRKRFALQMLEQLNLGRVLEVGCGKGTVTHLLKRQNNYVLGVDISPTAIEMALESFPDIDFRVMTAEEACEIKEIFDITVIMGTFAYVEGWKNCLKSFAKLSERCFVGEYIPPNPIGFVKSAEEFFEVFSEYFEIDGKVLIDDHHFLLMGRSKIFIGSGD